MVLFKLHTHSSLSVLFKRIHPSPASKHFISNTPALGISIVLVFDCFKMICMRSRTKKSQDVRQYYIDIEKALDSYKEHIINSFKEKIRDKIDTALLFV